MDTKKGNPSILIIDDNPDFREIVSAKLKAVGFEVATADGGEAGMTKALEVGPDLILLDIEMPNMTGPQVLKKMKEDSNLQHMKVAFLTSHGESNDDAWLDKKFANEIGAVGYIRKTDDLDKIIKEVQIILQNVG